MSGCGSPRRRLPCVSITDSDTDPDCGGITHGPVLGRLGPGDWRARGGGPVYSEHSPVSAERECSRELSSEPSTAR